MNFKQFFKEESQIDIVSTAHHWDMTTDITFLVRDTRYTYNLSTGLFKNNQALKSYLKHAPGKALNFIKKHGKLIKKH